MQLRPGTGEQANCAALVVALNAARSMTRSGLCTPDVYDALTPSRTTAQGLSTRRPHGNRGSPGQRAPTCAANAYES